MRGNLQTAAFHFGRSFNQDFLLLFRVLGKNPRGAGDGLAGEMASRIREWESQASHPQLLEAVFRIRGEGRGRQVWRLDGAQFAASPDSALPRPPFADPTEWIHVNVERDYDIVLRKDLDGFVLPSGGTGSALEDDGFLFVRLARTYLEGEFIPQLAASTLNAGGSAPYDVCVVTTGDSARVLFSTLPGHGLIGRGEEDVRAGLLMLPPMPLAMAPMPRREGGPEGGERWPEEWRQFPDRGRRPDNMRFDRGAPRVDQGRDDAPPDGRSPLELRARHRAGSLEAAVNQSRLRSLAISLGILLLMGVAVAVLLVSSYRAQRLAEQQIAFVAGVSHELRTPLAVMQSAGENLADGVVTEPGRVRAYGELIRTEVHRLTVLAENALAYAGIHSGKQQYTLAPVKVADVVTKAVSGCQAMMMEAGVKAELHQKNPSVTVRADAGALAAAVQNIITNAVKYSGESRQIDIAVDETAGTEGTEVCLTVRDYGIGIASHDVPHIFEPFYRGKTAREHQIRGNGLGLHLAHHVITAHGGTVAVQSTVGEGSLFSIRLPLYSSSPSPA